MRGCSFTPEEQVASIQKKFPGFKVSYKTDFRQQIAMSWPESLDDSRAVADWGWKPKYDLEAITDDMIRNIQKRE